MIARDIMTRKVYTISPEASVQEVAQLLSRKSISGVPVIDKDGKIIGIVTEADIIGKVNREGLRVADIMSPEIIAVDEETGVGEIAMLPSYVDMPAIIGAMLHRIQRNDLYRLRVVVPSKQQKFDVGCML